MCDELQGCGFNESSLSPTVLWCCVAVMQLLLPAPVSNPSPILLLGAAVGTHWFTKLDTGEIVLWVSLDSLSGVH